MCNNYRMHVPANQLAMPFTDIGRRLVLPDGIPNLEPTDYRIGDRAPVVLAGEGGLQLVMTPWAWKGPGGGPVFNFRSDGRSFEGSNRCLIPADGFFEFIDTEPGQKRKTKWRFTLSDQRLFWVAGLIKDGAFAMLTTEPGADIAPYHDRQIVLLRPEDGAAWLNLQKPEAELLRALPAGSLDAEKVFPVAA